MKRIILLPLLIALTCIVSWAQINTPSVQGYILRAQLMLKEGNPNGCRDQIVTALGMNPSDKELHDAKFLLAMSAVNNCDQDALQLLEDFLAQYPSSHLRSEALKAIADINFDNGQYGAALQQYLAVDQRALNESLCEDLIYRRGFCRLMTADYSLANQDFETLRKTSRYGNAALFYQGYIAYCKTDYTLARNLLSQADTNTSPGNKAPYYLMQIAYITGDNNSALSLAKRLINDATASPQFAAEAHRIAGEIYYSNGNQADAFAILSKYPALANQATMQPIPSALYILGLMEYQNSNYTQAIQHLTPATELDNAMAQNAYFHIGQCYRRTGNNNAAMVAFEKAAHMNFEPKVQEAAYYNYAVAKMDGGRVPFVSSVSVLENFLNRFPESVHAPEVQRYIIDGYISDNDYDSALRSIERIKNPSQQILTAKQRVLFSLGMRQFSTSETAAALNNFKQAKSITHADNDIANECNLWIGDCHYRMGDYDKAIKAYSAYLNNSSNSNSNRSLAQYNLGYSRYSLKQYDNAAANFKKVIASPGKLSMTLVADALNRLGDCYYHKSQFGEAVKYYDKAFQSSPYVGDYSLFQKAIMKGYAKDYKGKIKTLTLVEEKFSSSGLLPAVLLEKAEAYVALDDKNKAIDTYNQIIKRYPSTMQGRNALLQLAITHMNDNNRSVAIKTYKEVISTYPTSEEARVAADDLKRIYADEGRLDQYASFISSIQGAPQLEQKEIDALTFQAAEKHYLTNNETNKLTEYLTSFPSGAFRAQSLFYLSLEANNTGDKDSALKYATEIVNNHPDAESIEDALAIKGEIEFSQGKGEIALETFRTLKQRASSTTNLKIARLGIMRVTNEIGDYEAVTKVVDELTASLPEESEEMPEIQFFGANADFHLNNTKQAIKTFSALSKKPSTIYGAMSAVYLSQHYLDTKNYKKARSVVEELINSGTPHQYWLARGFIILSDINRAEGNTFEANEYLKTLQNNYPGNEADIFQMIEQRLSNN